MKNRFLWSFQKNSLCIIPTFIFSNPSVFYENKSKLFFTIIISSIYSLCFSKSSNRSWPMHFKIQFSILNRALKNPRVVLLDAEMLEILVSYKIRRLWKQDCIATESRELTCQVQVSSSFFNTSPLTSIDAKMCERLTSEAKWAVVSVTEMVCRLI